MKLNEEELKEITDIVSAEEVAGSRAYGFTESFIWKYANTPLPTSA